MKRKCSRCKVEKDTSEFNKKDSKRLSTYCSSCNRIYLKEHYRKNKDYYKNKTILRRKRNQKYLNSLKKRCCVCGEDCVACLDFHHKEGKKKEFNLGHAGLRGFSFEKMKEEIKKCIVVCSNCHRKIHANIIKI